MVKTKIAFTPKQRDQAHHYDVRKTCDTQKMNG
jgi:hypothetical protein